MEKKRISKQLAEQLESAISVFEGSKEGVLNHHVGGGTEPWFSNRELLNDLSVSDLAILLFIGYEIEAPKVTFNGVKQRRVEVLVSKYDEVKHADFLSYRDGVKDGINVTLRQLGITIEGINE
jgi:hypothetical protein